MTLEQEVYDRLQMCFQNQYGRLGHCFYFSPGRVNLIGEHIDYNGGHVFPCAITLGTYAVVKARPDRQVRCYSLNLPEVGVVAFSLDELNYRSEDDWVNYVKGMIYYFQVQYPPGLMQGFDLVIWGNLPNGAGLSSSASLELLIGVIISDLSQQVVPRLDLVKMGQAVENQYLGLQTGIMDQFVVGMGEEATALYLNVNSLDYQRVPADFGGYRLLIMNTNKRRELTKSQYNHRRKECESALAKLQQVARINHLCDLSWTEWEAYKPIIEDPILARRACHAVSENLRTQQAVEALQDRDLVRMGQLMNASHVSLRDDYDVTGPELDAMVAAAWSLETVLGARMTGAGMGGCALALVSADHIDESIAKISANYHQATGLEGAFYIAQVGPGTHKIASPTGRPDNDH